MKDRLGPWEIRAICPCGWWTYAPFGSLFHVHLEVCPTCGRKKREWSVRTARIVTSGPWYNRRAHLEFRDEEVED